MFLRRIFKGMPDLGPWVAVAELGAAMAGLAATLMALGVMPTPFGGAPAGTVSGTVSDSKTGKPVPEATVQIIDAASCVIAAESVPDEVGRWKETVKPGTYTVKSVCDGYRPMGKTVTVAADKTRVVRLVMEPEPKQVPQASAGGAAAPVRTVETRVIVGGGPSAGGGSARRSAPAQDSGGPAPSTASSGAGKSDQEAQKHFQKAIALQAKGDVNAAVKEAEKAVILDPEDGKIYSLLYQLEIERGNNAAAGDWAKDGKESATRNRASLP